MTGRNNFQDMCRLNHPGSFQYFCLRHCLLLLLIQKEVLCCPSVCHRCTDRQADCRNSGLSSIPKSFPRSSIFVYLSGNNISHVYPNELIGLQQLAVLHLDNANIMCVYPKAFLEFKKLWHLHLNNNHIKRLDPGTFEGLSNLYSLYLQNNEIAFVPRGLFSDLPSVRYLMLQSNRLGILGSSTFFGMIRLQVLNLGNNKISRISNAAFHHLGNLTFLYLEGNNLTRVPSNALVGLNNLEKLSLSLNPIGSILPFAFKGLDKLHTLSLKGANINTIHVNGFSALNHLKTLVLSNNNLETVNSSTFAFLDNLMFLQLNKNKIVNIADNTFEKMGSSLKILNLAFNNLTGLQPKVLKPLVSLTHLEANYNPWNCSCRLIGLINWLASSSVSANVPCQNPSRLRGRHLNYTKWGSFTNRFSASTRPGNFKKMKPAGVHHITATLLTAWDQNPTDDTISKLLKNMNVNSATLWPEIPTTTASRHLYEEFSVEKLKEAATVFSLLPAQIPGQLIPVNFTMQENGASLPEATSVSFGTSLICTQQVEKLNQAFDILLTFFILACAAIILLTYKIIQFRQKIKVPKNSENGIEYYSFYQPGRCNVTDPMQPFPQNNPQGNSGLDHVHLPKTTVLGSQAQVILFEHSAL